MQKTKRKRIECDFDDWHGYSRKAANAHFEKKGHWEYKEEEVEDTGNRVHNANDVLGIRDYYANPQDNPLKDGVHYEVLSDTLWADEYIPTKVRWANDKEDDLRNLAISKKNREESMKIVANAPSAPRGSGYNFLGAAVEHAAHTLPAKAGDE